MFLWERSPWTFYSLLNYNFFSISVWSSLSILSSAFTILQYILQCRNNNIHCHNCHWEDSISIWSRHDTALSQWRIPFAGERTIQKSQAVVRADGILQPAAKATSESCISSIRFHPVSNRRASTPRPIWNYSPDLYSPDFEISLSCIPLSPIAITNSLSRTTDYKAFIM